MTTIIVYNLDLVNIIASQIFILKSVVVSPAFFRKGAHLNPFVSFLLYHHYYRSWPPAGRVIALLMNRPACCTTVVKQAPRQIKERNIKGQLPKSDCPYALCNVNNCNHTDNAQFYSFLLKILMKWF